MGVRRALLVHNSRFSDPSLHPLPAADADVTRLQAMLGAAHVGFEPGNITTLANPSLTDFRTAVARFFRDAAHDDYLFFYYAGHGIRSETGELYLALRNTRVEDFEAMSLEAAFIRRSLARCMSRQKVVVLDCCNAGAFRSSGDMIARDAAYDPGLIAANFDPRGTGTYILGASQSGASAYETTGKDGRHYSLFTDAFIRGVETGEAAGQGDVITLIDISRYIHAQRNASGQATEPYLDVTNSVGLLEFARTPVLATGVPAKPAQTMPKPRRDQARPPRPHALYWLAGGLVLGAAVAGAFLHNGDPPGSAGPDVAAITPQNFPEALSNLSNDTQAAFAASSALSIFHLPDLPRPDLPISVAVRNAPGHGFVCATDPALRLDLSKAGTWDGQGGLFAVDPLPEGWDPAFAWLAGVSDGISHEKTVLERRIEFCSCDQQDARADIGKLRADNGFEIVLDGDRASVNFGTLTEVDLHSARSSPFSARLKSRASGDRVLSLRVDNKRAGVPLGFAIAGKLQAANSYIGRCRN